MRDYKKGSFLRSPKSGVLIPGLPADTPEQKDQQRRVFEKIWKSVERIMGELRTRLDAGLKDPSRPVEEQEKTIEWVQRPNSEGNSAHI